MALADPPTQRSGGASSEDGAAARLAAAAVSFGEVAAEAARGVAAREATRDARRRRGRLLEAGAAGGWSLVWRRTASGFRLRTHFEGFDIGFVASRVDI